MNWQSYVGWTLLGLGVVLMSAGGMLSRGLRSRTEATQDPANLPPGDYRPLLRRVIALLAIGAASIAAGVVFLVLGQ